MATLEWVRLDMYCSTQVRGVVSPCQIWRTGYVCVAVGNNDNDEIGEGKSDAPDSEGWAAVGGVWKYYFFIEGDKTRGCSVPTYTYICSHAGQGKWIELHTTWEQRKTREEKKLKIPEQVSLTSLHFFVTRGSRFCTHTSQVSPPLAFE